MKVLLTYTSYPLCLDDWRGRFMFDLARELAARTNVSLHLCGLPGPTPPQASFGRWFANSLHNRLSSWMVNHRIQDLSSGFRAVRRNAFLEFLHMLPNGFSYPTTITMAFFRAGYSVSYVPVSVQERSGESHISPLRDGARFFLVIFRVGTLYSPLKIFIPISFGFFVLGLGYYLYTYILHSRFTNMSALLLSTSVIIGLIGPVSEQITNLLYTSQRPQDEQ